MTADGLDIASTRAAETIVPTEINEPLSLLMNRRNMSGSSIEDLVNSWLALDKVRHAIIACFLGLYSDDISRIPQHGLKLKNYGL
jgi:hypothetical protein